MASTITSPVALTLNQEHSFDAGSEDVTGISVVTPTHGRNALLSRLLTSLQTARANASLPIEILIIDSSPQAEADTIHEACKRFGASYIRHPVNNVREKRNLGIEESRYPVVLFIDSDCEASPRLIEEHAKAYSNGVGGVVGLTCFVGETSWVWKLIEKTSVLNSFNYARVMKTAPWGPTCNISYRKKALEAVDGFDTSWPFRLGGDDVDLGLRVTDLGCVLSCNPQAVVEHTRDTWNRVSLIVPRLFRWGRMHQHLMTKHSEKLLNDFPTSPGIFFMLLLVLLPVVAVRQRLSLLFLPLLWVSLSLLIETLLMCRLDGKRKDFGYYLGARVFGLTFETGTLLEGLKHGSIRPFYKEIHYTQPSVHSPGRNRRIVQLWASILALLVLLPFYWWF